MKARFPIRIKLFLILAGMTILVAGGLLMVINRTVEEMLRDKLLSDFNRTRDTFQTIIRLRYERLVESCYLIGENSTFKANVSLADPASVAFSVNEFALYTLVDLFIVTDRNGNVLARLDEPDKFGDSLRDRPSVQNALRGIEPDIEISAPDLWLQDGQLYQVVSRPIYAGPSLIGTITLGTRFTQAAADQLKGNSTVDITLAVDQKLLGSTVGKINNVYLSEFAQSHSALVDSVLRSNTPTTPFETSLAGVPVFAYISPLGHNESAWFVASEPISLVLTLIRILRSNLYLAAGLALVLTVLLAGLIGRFATRPILKLTRAMNDVRDGNLNVRVRTRTSDEIGLLGQSFNEMIGGLRERMHLMRYVGDHTKAMVRRASGGEGGDALGGERRDLAVLFSDIRGFTSFSENRPPEEVIGMLNRFLGFQADIVREYHGTVDKFVGDEMVAVFDGNDAFAQAVKCGIAIQRRMEQANRKGEDPIRIGIGVNYGPMLLGNMGSADRMDYTMIGAEVNVCARLCAAAPPNSILVRRTLADQHLEGFRFGKSVELSLKGISHPVEAVEVLWEGIDDDQNSDQHEKSNQHRRSSDSAV